MENNKLKLFLTFPLWYFFSTIGFMLVLPIYCIVFINDTILGYLQMSFLLIGGIYMSIILVGANILRRIGYIINKNGIIFFNLFGKKMFLWKELISYSITGTKNNLYLNFQTRKSSANKNIIKSRNVISISSKLYKIKMDELINKVNEIKGSNVA